jgi:glycopeptide antibiotics resistance protein
MNENRLNRLTYVLFVIYLISIFWIIVFKFNIPLPNAFRSINLIPFRESLLYNGIPDFVEIILNVLIFIPLGLYSGLLFKSWNNGKKFLLFFLISLTCEVLQYILEIGTSDITDVITNIFGGIIGLIVYSGIEKAFSNSLKTQKFINIIALSGTILIFLFLFLLKIKHLWIFRMETLY